MGKQTQFIPWHGVYVIARQYEDKTVMTVLNGKKETASLEVKRYAEIIGQHTTATDVTTGKVVKIDENVKLKPRQTMILEF